MEGTGGVATDERVHFLPADETAQAGALAPTPDREMLAHPPTAWALWRPLLLTAPRSIGRELAADSTRGAAFLCLPILMGAGAVSYFSLSREPNTLALALAATVLVLATFLFRGRPLAFAVSAALLSFVLGMGAGKLETWRAGTPMLGSEVTTHITGRLVRLEEQANGRFRLVIDVVGTERPHLRHPPDRVRLTARKVPSSLRPGDGIKGLARLMPPSGPIRPGGYDFSFASYFDHIAAIGFFMSGPERVQLPELPPVVTKPARWLETIREALAAHIRAEVHGAEGEVVVAMVVGFRPGIPEEVNEWLRRSGLAHILSISGLHMALVAATVMFLLRAGAALFPAFVSRFPVKKYAAAAALAFCTLYLFISGADVAAQRSFIMLAVMLAALLLDRAALTMRNVAIAALIIIAFSPHEVVGPSFQMSFAATAALVASFAAWSEWRRQRIARGVPSGPLVWRIASKAAGFVIGLAATSLIAGTATALYGIWHFQRATPLSLPANLAAVPLVSLVAMPSAVLAMLAMPFGLDGFFLRLMGDAMAIVIAIARWFSERSPFDAVGLIPLSALFAFTAALVVLVVSTTRLRLVAVPLIALGAGLLMMRDPPDVLISEDARLVGVAGSGVLSVNRARPNGFTVRDWARALRAETIKKPANGETRPDPAALPEAVFSCGEGLCLARHESGALIAHAESAAAARAACAFATLIVVDDATTEELCGGDVSAVITKRDLARRGSAAVQFRRERTAFRAEIAFAIEESWRPWHLQRAWSRAARGLPPYERKKAAMSVKATSRKE